MHGNVWELCLNVPNYTKELVINPIVKNSSGNAVRGGSWINIWSARSRGNWSGESKFNGSRGFRVAFKQVD